MTDKLIVAECVECESSFELAYAEELVSETTPSFCPFCGEPIENIREEYIDEDELDEDGDRWA